MGIRRVRNIITKAKVINSAREIEKDLKKEALKDKLPILEEIATLTLTGVRDFLKENPKPGNATEAKAYVDMVRKIDEMVRLELGKPTAITQETRYSLQQTQVIFEELRQLDPVFDYPDIVVTPEPEEKEEEDIL